MRRPTVGLACQALGAPLLAALLSALPVRAQAVVGRIVDVDGGAGVPGAFVVLADSAGRRRAAVLTDGEGRFVMTAPAPGTYTLRAERIGMTTRRLPAFVLAAGERRSVSLALAADAIPLAAIEVSAKKGRCEVLPEAGAATARVWEEVRKALRVSSWARSAGHLEYTLRRQDRVIDLTTRLVRSDSVLQVTAAGERPYASLTPEELRRDGYVRGDPQGGYSYWGPDEDVLSSDEFLASHCLVLRPRSTTPPGMLAIDFRRARRTGTVDIEGTAWLEARTSELRWIDFEYAGLSFPSAGAGGTVEFRRLPSGSWIVNRWRLAFPLLHLRHSYQLGGGYELQPYALHETLGEVLELRVPGAARPLVRADSGRSGTISGQVYDSAHARPLVGARVYLSGTVHAATTDSAGHFRIAGVPAARYTLAFDHPAMDSLPVRPAPVEVDVPPGGQIAIALAVPGSLELRRRACPGDSPDPRRPLVFGRVRDASGVLAVRVLWQEIEGEMPRLVIRQQGVDVPVDPAGRFIVCAPLPDRRPVSLRAVKQMPDGRKLYGEAVQVVPARDGVYRIDLALPTP